MRPNYEIHKCPQGFRQFGRICVGWDPEIGQLMRFKTHEGWVIDDAYQAVHYSYREMLMKGQVPVYSIVDLTESAIPATGNIIKMVKFMRSMMPKNHVYSVSVMPSNPMNLELYSILEAAMKLAIKIGPARKFYSEQEAREFIKGMIEQDLKAYGHPKPAYL